MTTQESFGCTGVGKQFGGITALQGVSLRFDAGTVAAIIGPNGAGKTTLFNVLTGFLRPDHGHCFLGAKDLTRLAPYRIVRAGIARTFQDLRIIRGLSTLDNLLLAMPEQQGESIPGALWRAGVSSQESRNRDEALSWLRMAAIERLANRTAGELSYGQQKLLSIACCLATGARVLLLDEPFSGVHPEMIGTMRDLVASLHARGYSIVFIEHDISAVRNTAKRVIVLDHGCVVADGQTDEVLSRPEILEAYCG